MVVNCMGRKAFNLLSKSPSSGGSVSLGCDFQCFILPTTPTLGETENLERAGMGGILLS